jgi:hypothetical protein
MLGYSGKAKPADSREAVAGMEGELEAVIATAS